MAPKRRNLFSCTIRWIVQPWRKRGGGPMKNRRLAVGVVLVLTIFLMPAFSSIVESGSPMTPSETLRSALLQLRNEFGDDFPEGTWSGWDGSESGLTATSGATPSLTFDSTTIVLPADNTGTAAPTSAGVTYPDLPPKRGGTVYVAINRSYVDSDLLRMKTVLAHELVHVGQWRDPEGHYDSVGGTTPYNWTKEANLTDIKEIQASGLTIKLLQKLLKKGEFKKSSIWAEIKREMGNLQKHLKRAVDDAKNITAQGWGADLLKKWFPLDLIKLILWKKLMLYGFATSGTIKVDEVSHVMEVTTMMEVFDSEEDGLIYGLGYGQVIVEGFKYLKYEKEIRGHVLANGVMSYYKGNFGVALNQLDAYINHINAQRSKYGDEVCDGALEFVDHMRSYMTVVDVFPPQPEIINPLDGMIIGRWSIVEAVELTGADDVVSTVFEISPDGAIWTEIGVDPDPSDGWWIEFDTKTLPNGPYFIMATMTDNAGNAGSDEVSIFIDNF